MMKKRTLGSTLLQISELGLGCMSLGSDENEAIQTIHAAIDAGINYIDTADLYDFGRNEEIVGKALKDRRDQVVLATKVGNRWNQSKDTWSWDPSKKHIQEGVKESLLRLNTDYIDLYQLHGGTIEDHYEETIEAFDELVKEGTIRYYGISSIRPNVFQRFSKHSSIQSVMMQYNVLERRPEEFFSQLAKQSISVIVRGAVAKGLLTNNWQNKIKSSGYMSYSEHELIETINQLTQLLDQDQTLHSLALHYLLQNNAVSSLAVGARDQKQLSENISAYYSNPLSNQQVTFIKEHTHAETYTDHR